MVFLVASLRNNSFNTINYDVLLDLKGSATIAQSSQVTELNFTWYRDDIAVSN